MFLCRLLSQLFGDVLVLSSNLFRHFQVAVHARIPVGNLAAWENRPVSSWDLHRTCQEAVNQVGNFICCRIQREVIAIDSLHLRLRNIAAERFRFGIIERKFVHAPKNGEGRLGLAHPLLPLWVGSDVGLVIVKQIALDVGLAWLVQEPEFIGPQIRIVTLYLGIVAHMPRTRGGKREQIRAQSRLVGGTVGPKSAAEVPVFPETGIMRHGILNDQRLNALRVGKSQPKANGPAIVLHVEAIMRQAERLGNMLHHCRNVVEGVREFCMISPIAMAETRIIRRNQVIAVGQALSQRFSGPRIFVSMSEAASATLGCSRKSVSVAIDTPSLTTRLTLSSEPKWCRAAVSTFRQAMATALRPSSTVSSAPSRPREAGLPPATGNIPLKKSRLPVCTTSTYAPNAVGTGGS